jgi:hypothetical protein
MSARHRTLFISSSTKHLIPKTEVSNHVHYSATGHNSIHRHSDIRGGRLEIHAATIAEVV